MAYIPYTYVPIGKSRRKRARYTLPTGGALLTSSDMTVQEGKCESICNFDILADRIRTRGTPVSAGKGFFASGRLNGIFRDSFCERLVFHVGCCLYAYDPQSDSVSLLADSLPDSKSLLCPFMSRLYIYCATHVYSVGDDFKFREETDIFAPVMYDGVVPSSTATQKRNGTPFNLVAPRIAVEYINSDVSSFRLPEKADVDRPFEVYKDGVLCEADEYEVSERTVKINDGSMIDNKKRAVKIAFYLADLEAAGYEDIISSCNIVTAFGGNTNDGTRMFFTGNENKKGYYYKSELRNALHVNADEYEIIGDGNENITAVKKMYGDLIIFTSSSVFRMSYSYSGDGTVFAVKELSSEAGCDCPRSVQLIDNRVVFASSQKGIFIVEPSGDTGEHNIKPLSGNIKSGGGMGLLDNERSTLAASCGVDFDRKYMLFTGTKAYIWDYDMTAFRESSSYSASQMRLCWYMYDGIGGSFFANVGARLVSLHEENGVYLEVFSSAPSETQTVTRFKSGISECFYPLVRKFVTDFCIKLKRQSETALTLTLYADGERYYETRLPKTQKESEKLLLHLPKKALYGFGFEINGRGRYEIEEITADFIEISE